MNLFTYGTLMNAEIMASLVGRSLAFQKGRVQGCARHPVQSGCYPGLIFSGDGHTEGIVYSGLQPDDWPILDWFEDTLYTRQEIGVDVEGPGTLPAQVYMVQPNQQDALCLDSAWSFEQFMTEDYPEYLSMCREARKNFLQQEKNRR